LGAALVKKACSRCGRGFEADAAFCPDDGTPLEPDLPLGPDSDPYIGRVLPGDIEIRGVAGVGAMGRVYRAHQRGIDRDVAVKILHRELSGNLPLVQRFHREAKIASRLQHPHVVEVYLAGQLPDGALYIVMEYLDGSSLASALGTAGGTFDLTRALSIALQICDAVGEGHARGIVHRDLKPENVMLVHRADTSDWVKVLDFGIAKVSVGEQSMETAAGLIFGTARYISPEGAHGATVGPPGDVYAIATILYQLLAGRTPFDAEQPVGLLVKHLHEAPPDLRSWPHAAEVPEPIARVIMANLAKRPSERAPHARSLGNALAGAAKEAGVVLADVGVVARMSMLETPRARAERHASGASAAPKPIEPTVDDLPAAPPVRVITSNTPISARDAAAEQFDVTSADVPAVRVASAPPPSSQPSSQTSSQPTEAPRRSPLPFVLLAFLLGAALAALAVQHIANRKDTEHAEQIDRARRALLAEQYVRPSGDNVRDLTADGLRRWPSDPEFSQVRSDAAAALVTRAMAVRSAGDLEQARDLARLAVDFEPHDRAAAILLDQYEDELRLSADGGAGPPHALLDVPEVGARAGVRAELVAQLLIAGAPPKGGVADARFTITGPNLATKGSVLPATAAKAPGTFTAAFVPPRDGTYEVVFEANSGGIPFRAERTFDVSK